MSRYPVRSDGHGVEVAEALVGYDGAAVTAGGSAR